ncbi:transposase, partial [Oceanobacillus sp. CFH 90083]|uniref:transposase n=1 Tax=Oceanobacillus sp. CFH 90083 TaxID=2592336 RepID=UPI001D149D06
KWEEQKKMIREQLSDKEMGKLYGKRKIDVEPFFGFLKANLGFTRFSVRGKPKVDNELGFALMAVNLRRYTASTRLFMYLPINDFKKDGFRIKTRCEIHLFFIIG